MQVNSSLNVRSGPGTSYSSIGSLANGAKVSLLSQSGEWYAISYNGQTGYIFSSYVKLDSSVPDPEPDPDDPRPSPPRRQRPRPRRTRRRIPVG